MLKKTTVLVLYLSFPGMLFAQQITQSVFLSQGTEDRTESMALEWTLGDSAVETLFQDESAYTQGFLQPELIFKSSSKIQTPVFDASIFPNPFGEELYIKVNSTSLMNIEMIDMNGRSLDPEITKLDEGSFSIQAENLASGIYLISLFDTNNNQLKVFRVLKK